MRMRSRTTLVSGVAAVAMVVSMSAAFASHFRASNSALTYNSSSHVLTWTINSAWRKDNDDDYFDDASDIDVTDSNGNAVNSVTVGTPTSTRDQSNPLYAITHNSATLDISSIVGTPGRYQAYTTDCCRIGSVQNTNSNDDFSQLVSWTVNSNGSVNMPPEFNNPVLYALVPVGSGSSRFTVDYTATDPERSAVTYSLITNTGDPDYGATPLPCSSFANHKLTVARSLCTGNQNFNASYQAGYYYAVKVRATDAAGNSTVEDTLLRVPGVPAPEIDDITTSKSRAVVTVVANDTVVDTYTVTCTNSSNLSDVHTASSSTSPVTVTGLRSASSYDCVAKATNALGTGTSDEPYSITTDTFQTQSITFPPLSDVPLKQGHRAVAATASSGLPVTFTSRTPRVCTLSGGTVTLHRGGTCTIVANQPGNSTYDSAPEVRRSFEVLLPRTKASLAKPRHTLRSGRLASSCSLTVGNVRQCVVIAYATVNGHRIAVGRGHVVVHSASGKKHARVAISFTKQGRALVRRPGGVRLTLRAAVLRVDDNATHYARTATLAVAPLIRLKPVYFAFDSPIVSKHYRAYLAKVRDEMGDVHAVACSGHTDYAGSDPHEKSLSLQRAENVCALLTRKHHDLRVRTAGHGGSDPVTKHGSAKSRAKNRRVGVTLSY